MAGLSGTWYLAISHPSDSTSTVGGAIDVSTEMRGSLNELFPVEGIVEPLSGSPVVKYRKLFFKNGTTAISSVRMYFAETEYKGRFEFALEKSADDTSTNEHTAPSGYVDGDFKDVISYANGTTASGGSLSSNETVGIWVRMTIPVGVPPEIAVYASLAIGNGTVSAELSLVSKWLKESTTRWLRQNGSWGWTTQELGNEFPRWHMARLNPGGPSQQLISSWGHHIDKMKLEFGKFRKTLFLETAPVDEADVFEHAGVADWKESSKFRYNILSNPAFSMRGLARRQTPMWWNSGKAHTTGTFELTRRALLGTYSVKLTAAQDEECYLSQERRIELVPGSITLSAWYMSPMPEDTISTDASLYGLFLRVVYADGTSEMFTDGLLIGTDGDWVRATTTATLAKEVYSVKAGIYLKNPDAQTVVVYIGGMQLEEGEAATSWSSSPLSRRPFVEEYLPFTHPIDAYIDEGSETESEEVVTGSAVSFTTKRIRELYLTQRHETFWEDVVPDSIEISASTGTPMVSQQLQFGWYATPEEYRTWNTSWRIVSNTLQQYNSDISNETIGEFKIGEFWLDEDGTTNVGVLDSSEDPGFSRTLETFTFIRQRLWLVCKETEGGVTKRILKILDPWSRWPLPIAYDQALACVHLETIGDVEIPNSSGTASFLGALESDPDKLMITIDGSDYILDLKYDYFMLATNERRAIVRSSHEGTLLTV